MHLDISYKSIYRIALVLFLFWILYQVLFEIVDVLMVLFFSIIISASIGPEVDKLEKEGFPRIIGAALIYILVFLAFSLIVYLILPPTIEEISKLSGELPNRLREYMGTLTLPENFFEQVRQTLASASDNIFAWLFGLVGGLGNILFVFIISFYLTVQDQAIKQFFQSILPQRQHAYALDLIVRSQSTLSQWLNAQLILMLLVGISTFVALLLIGVPHALALGALAGLLEIIPFIGPLIAAVPAVLFSLGISPFTAIITVMVFLIIQQLESHVFTPLVMKRTFEINPLLVLIALFIGGKLGGTVGILASVPLLALILEFSKDYYRKGEDKS